MKRGLIAGRFLAGALSAWALAVVFVFCLGMLVPAWPSWLELPWSSFDDFAVTPEGKILVCSSFFSRILIYDREGDFEASLPGLRARGEHRLAVDFQGRIYVAASSTLCVLGSGDLRCRTGPEDLAGWQLDWTGEVQPVLHPIPARNGIVQKGEVLTSRSARRRPSFSLESGLVVERTGDRLLVREPGRDSRSLSTPWYLYWAKFPFPGSLAWVAAFLIGGGLKGMGSWKRARSKG